MNRTASYVPGQHRFTREAVYATRSFPQRTGSAAFVATVIFEVCPEVDVVMLEAFPERGFFQVRTVPALPQNDQRLREVLDDFLPFWATWEHAR